MEIEKFNIAHKILIDDLKNDRIKNKLELENRIGKMLNLLSGQVDVTLVELGRLAREKFPSIK